MPGHDVDHAADRVGSVERRALGAANHFDALDCLGRELRDQQRIGQLDSIHIDLRIAGPEGAGPSDAPVVRDQRCRRTLPDPQPRHQVAQRLREIALGVARELSAADDVHRHGEPADRSLDCAACHDDAVEHARRMLALFAVARRFRRSEHDVLAPSGDREDWRSPQQKAERLPNRNRVE